VDICKDALGTFVYEINTCNNYPRAVGLVTEKKVQIFLCQQNILFFHLTCQYRLLLILTPESVTAFHSFFCCWCSLF